MGDRSQLAVRLLPSAADGAERQYSTSFVVNDALAVDAGSVGFVGSPTEQERISDVLITHSHQDHIASLPILVGNVHREGSKPVRVHAGRETLDCLRSDVFNDRVWPDLVGSVNVNPPWLTLHELEPEQPVEIAGLRVTPVPVSHTVPTYAFVLEGAGTAIVIGGDTGPTDRLWEVARAVSGLRAVFLEVSFPDSCARMAELSQHLTPSLFAGEVAKLDRDVEWIAFHLKARFQAETVEELVALGLPNLRIGSVEDEYRY